MILAIGMALIAGTGHAGVLDVAAVIGGFGHGYLYPALSALVIARTDLSAMGRSSSIYTSLYDAGTMAGPYVLGIVGESFGYGRCSSCRERSRCWGRVFRRDGTGVAARGADD